MSKYYVVVNRHKVQSNRKYGEQEPVFRISKGKYGKPFYAVEVEFPEGATLTEDTENPLPCGATVWIEAEEVVIDV